MIRAEHIVKSFDGRVVLDDISVEFETGKTNLIIGRSGSGKTVLLKTLVGLHEPDSGDVWYDEVNFSKLGFRERKSIRKDIGMIFQGGALLDSSTVVENVKLPLDLFTSQSEREKMERVNFCLQRVRLDGANELYPAELSGGMIKRVAIARAIVMNPRYLFCDEPNSGLDPQTSIVIDNLIHEITQENVKLPLDLFTSQSEREKMERVNFCLQRVRLDGANELYPAELSGGMIKRVAIARAIVMNPRYLFCDEPNSGLDPQTSIVIDNLIHEITQEYGITTIINTHDMNSVMEIGEKIVYIHDGRKWWEGTKDDILHADNRELNDFVFASAMAKRAKLAAQ